LIILLRQKLERLSLRFTVFNGREQMPQFETIKRSGVKTVGSSEMESKARYLVTGANAGIGKAVAEGLAQKGLPVVMICRNREKAQAALNEIRSRVKNADIRLITGDLSDNAGVRKTAAAILEEVPRIAALINNAGVWMTRCELNADGIEKSFYVNCLAPFLLSALLLERLKESAPARIVNVNAVLYVFGKIDLDHTPYGRDFSMIRSYCNSKLASVLVSNEMAKRLEGTGVTVNLLHPGVIRTGLGVPDGILGKVLKAVKFMWKTPEKGAEPVIHLAESDEVKGVSGKFFMLKKEMPLIGKAKDNVLSDKLWSLGESLTGMNSKPSEL
jgi:NAD(P)-dependent dehydrogenase (short-subunit alcohol dehydrogenase family)